MTGDTSARQEWYESDYQPGPQEHNAWAGLLTIASFGASAAQASDRLTQHMQAIGAAMPKVGDIAVGRDGQPYGIYTHVDPVTGQTQVAVRSYHITSPRRGGRNRIGQHFHAVLIDEVKKFQQAAIHSFDQTRKTIEQAFGIKFTESAPESVRDRALRLKRQPHSRTEHNAREVRKRR